MTQTCGLGRSPSRGAGWPGILLVGLAVGATVSLGCGVRVGEGDRPWNELVRDHRQDRDLGGYRMHYVDIGQGLPVVMVHGFADSTYCWHRNVTPLRDAGLRVILVDQPGMGRSEAPPAPYAYTVENQAGAILALLDRLAVDRFTLVGSSMGGGIALYLGLEHPDRVVRAVVLDPVCYRPPDHGMLRLLRLPGAPTLGSLLPPQWTVKRALRDAYHDPDRANEVVVEEYARPMRRKGYLKTLAALQAEYFSPAFDRMTESYDRFGVPLLILWGQEDTWVPPAFGERLHEEIVGSRLQVLPACGHLPHQEDPETVNRLLVDFLSEGSQATARRR